MNFKSKKEKDKNNVREAMVNSIECLAKNKDRANV